MNKQSNRILVVDDSPTVRRLVELILTQQGYSVHTAEDGARGLELARAISPAAILVDFVMPRMNGHMFCKILRAEPALADVPVILISSKGEAVGQAFEETFGIVHYFTKPFEPEDLVAKLEEVLGSSAAATAPQWSEPTAAPLTPAAGGTLADLSTSEAMLNVMHEQMDKVVRQYFQKDFPLLMKTVLSDTLRETGLVKHDTLALSGDLSRIALPDILNFIHNSRLSGRLTIFARNTFGEIFLDNGMFVFATVSRQGAHQFLTDLICRDARFKCDKQGIAEVVEEARQQGVPVGKALVARGVITDPELMSYLQRHAQDAFNAILEVSEGNFFLEEDALPLNLQDISFRVPLMQVLMEGLRLLDEKQLAQTEFQDEEVVLVRLITNEDALEAINMTKEELDFFSIVDGRKTLRELIKAMKGVLTPMETKRICYSLSKIGLLQRKRNI